MSHPSQSVAPEIDSASDQSPLREGRRVLIVCGVFVAVVVVSWFGLAPPPFRWQAGPPVPEQAKGELSPAFVTIRTMADFERMRSAKRALVFVDVEWSLYLPKSRETADDLAATVKAKGPENIELFRLDMTDQNSALFDASHEWLAPQNASVTLVRGYGAILWIREGRVVDQVDYAHEEREGLWERTAKAFAH